VSGQFAAELADSVLDHLGLPAPNDPEHLICRCDGIEREADQHAAHVAAVLREQIVTWLDGEAVGELTEAMWSSRLDLSHRPVQWRDEDNGYNAGLDHAAGEVRGVMDALAAQVAPSRVPGEET
jgi:hypothetical protein